VHVVNIEVNIAASATASKLYKIKALWTSWTLVNVRKE